MNALASLGGARLRGSARGSNRNIIKTRMPCLERGISSTSVKVKRKTDKVKEKQKR